MAGNTLDHDEMAETVRIHSECGSVAETARRLGLARSTVSARLVRAEQGGIRPAPAKQSRSALDLPDFPSKDLPIQDLIDHACKRYKALQRGFASQDWFPVKVKERKPIGIVFVGDLHVDDNGTDWPSIVEDFETIRDCDGAHAIFIGDVTNNWPMGSQLVRLYASQDDSLDTARRKAEWVMLHSGVPWLMWLMGNHDSWDSGADILAHMASKYGTHKMVCHDWDAQFRVVFPTGIEYRIWAAHNFKGSSQYHNMHGLIKAALLRAEADVYVAGHFHNAGYHYEPYVERNMDPHFIRVSGYKKIDQHARVNGFTHPGKCSSCMVILDPHEKHVHVDFNLKRAAEYLTWLRGRA